MTNKKKRRKLHATKIVYVNCKRCFIDKDIAPLIKKLNKLGIFTGSSCQASCQGYCGKIKHDRACKNYVFLTFRNAEFATHFLRLVSRNDSLRNLMFGFAKKTKGFDCSKELWSFNDRWIWQIGMEELNDEFDPYFIVCLFPRKHLNIVMARVLEA